MPVYRCIKITKTIEEVYAKDENQARQILQNNDPFTTVTVGEQLKTKKLDDDLLDALEDDISFQEFLEETNNTQNLRF